MAQELNCIVVINGDNIPQVDQRQIDEMQTAFAQFLNSTVWTEDRFENQERINCVVNLTLNGVTNQTLFSGTAQIQASRPVYGTGYETLILRYFDQAWEFEYNPGQALNYNENAFTNNITALLAYYANVILALDYDSFSPMGGSEFFAQAWNIVNLAQNTGRGGWDQFQNNGRNRYVFANLMANGQMDDVREAWYDYHLKGLDQFLTTEEEARAAIGTAIGVWKTANDRRPNTIVNTMLMDTKADELIKVFQKGDRTVRQQAYASLIELDPTQTDRFEEIIQN